ncbi:MAG: glycosyl hydrolase family 18 protein [Chloroflexi bacterium]|nr:glycosyl hydrolase family 18 protein [Chloroflexota bacterium]
MMSKKAPECVLAMMLFLFGAACSSQTPATVDEARAITDVSARIATPEVATNSVPSISSTTTPNPTAATGNTTITPTAAAKGPLASIPTSAKRKGNIVLGYYVSYDTTSWASLEAHANALDYVALQIISPDACGNIGSESDLTLLDFAHSRGVKVLPSVFTSSRWLNHRLLADEATTPNFVKQLTSYVVEEGYDGLDVDLEDIESGDRKALTSFISRLSESLHDEGKLLTMAMPAKSSDVTTGWAGPFDYAALAPYVDLFTIMSYSYTYSSSPPGSTAPIEWVEKVMAFATSQIPSRKVLLGVPFYGYDWNLTTGASARALRYPQAEALSAKHGVPIATDPASKSARMSYSARPGDQPPADRRPPTLDHRIKSRARPPCPAQPATPTPAPFQPPKPTRTPAAVEEHVVWLEDAASAEARLRLVEKLGSGGIGAWRLGQEDPKVWPVLEAWR